MNLTQKASPYAAQSSKFFQYARDFFILNKPVIVALLLFTTYTGMVVGRGSLPGFGTTFWTLLGGAFSAGGAGAINQFIDRDIDKLMKRTENRPMASGRLSSIHGLIYGITSCLIGLLVLASYVNFLSAFLSLLGMLYYLFIYSAWLKRITVLNIVIGGGAGAVPTLVGWAAATGKLEIQALFLFITVFLWTPTHFWSFALLHQDDYAHAGIPILPTIRGEKSTHQQIFFYSLLLVIFTVLMHWLNAGSNLFLIGAVVSGAVFLYFSLRLVMAGQRSQARAVYIYSNIYLALLFLVMILDVLFGRR